MRKKGTVEWWIVNRSNWLKVLKQCSCHKTLPATQKTFEKKGLSEDDYRIVEVKWL